jgi:hypothetical protein
MSALHKPKPGLSPVPVNHSENGVDLGAQTFKRLLSELKILHSLERELLKPQLPMHGTLSAIERHALLVSQLAEGCLNPEDATT